MQSWFSFELDGEPCRVEREDTHGSLASFLSRLDPCFAHFADQGHDRTPRLVIIGVLEGERHRFRAVDAANVMLPMVADRQVWTPEGIRNSEPEHPVNLAYQDGQYECGAERLDSVIALTFEGYYRPDLRRRGQINDQFDAIATRTANVPAIREAATQVFASTEQLRHEAALRAERSGQEIAVWTGRKDIFGDRYTKQLFRLGEQKSLHYVDGSKRRFFRPGTLVELLKLKREYGDSILVAGGTGLNRSAGNIEFPNLISLEGVKELNSILTTGESWEIGASVSLTETSETIGRECIPFAKMLRRFGTRPMRNRATLGGYLASAWPGGPLAPLLMALNARVIMLSEDGERDAPVSQFYSGNGRTILQPNELIRSIVIPRVNETILSSRAVTSRLCDAYSVSPNRTNSTSYASGAFAVELRDKQITKAWLAYSGIADAPARIREVEEFLVGRLWEEKTLIEMLPVLNQAVVVSDSHHPSADAEYLKQLVGTLFQKFFYQHPRPDCTRPESLTATGEFAKLDEPFFDAIPSS